MPIEVPLAVIRRNSLQRISHVRAHVVVPIFVQRQRAARVLHEQVQQANFVVAKLGELGDDFVGDEVGAAGARGEGECFLEPRHFLFAFGLICSCVFGMFVGMEFMCWVWGFG